MKSGEQKRCVTVVNLLGSNIVFAALKKQAVNVSQLLCSKFSSDE